MLKDLHIQNYRLFEDFKMDGLGRVNLIAGKNNTGKTALLEALRILASEGVNDVISNIVHERGEYLRGRPESFDSLFPRKSLQLEKELIQIRINNIGISRTKKGKWPRFDVFQNGEEEPKSIFELSGSVGPENPRDEAIFIPFYIDQFQIQAYWKNIGLTKDEDEVVKVLQTIEPKIERLNIYQDGAKIRMSDEVNPVPLKNLGEGANRLLVLALALVSAKNKMLLIDEFEAGLHYSVQEQLWDIIFEYAKKWDIQVFATTHSMDAVKSFFYVLEKEENEDMGKFFRLQRSRQGQIEAISYAEDKLEFALEHQLDPR